MFLLGSRLLRWFGYVGIGKGPHLHFGLNAGTNTTDQAYCISPYYIDWQFKDASPSRSGKLWWEVDDPSNPSAVSDGKNPAGNAKLRDWTPSRVVGAEPYAAVNLNKITIPAGTQLEIQQIGYNAIGTGCQILWTHSSDVAADGTVFVLQLTAKPDIATRIPHGSQRPISGVGLFRTGQSTKP